MSTQTPSKELFTIMTGAKNAMYTLRHLEEIGVSPYGNPIYGWVYITNLSRDRDVALQKATLISGMPESEITFSTEGELNDYDKNNCLSEEEFEALKAQKQVLAEEAAKRRFEEGREMIECDLWPFFGRNYGEHILSAIGKDNIDWWANNDFEAGSLAELLQEWVITNLYQFLAPRQLLGAGYVGKIGERIRAKLTVIRSIFFMNEWGGSTLSIMVDNQGKTFTVFSGSFYEEVGSTVDVAGTVKEHKDYNGVNQTQLQRVKIYNCEESLLKVYSSYKLCLHANKVEAERALYKLENELAEVEEFITKLVAAGADPSEPRFSVMGKNKFSPVSVADLKKEIEHYRKYVEAGVFEDEHTLNLVETLKAKNILK